MKIGDRMFEPFFYYVERYRAECGLWVTIGEYENDDYEKATAHAVSFSEAHPNVPVRLLCKESFRRLVAKFGPPV